MRPCDGCGGADARPLGGLLLCPACRKKLYSGFTRARMSRVPQSAFERWVSARVVRKECEWCGAAIRVKFRRYGDPVPAHNRKYCSDRCRVAAKQSRAVERKLAVTELAYCECGAVVPLGRRTFCSAACAERAKRRNRPRLFRLSLRDDALRAYGGADPRCCQCSSRDRLCLRVEGEKPHNRRGYFQYRALKAQGWPAGPRVMCRSCVARAASRAWRTA